MMILLLLVAAHATSPLRRLLTDNVTVPNATATAAPPGQCWHNYDDAYWFCEDYDEDRLPVKCNSCVTEDKCNEHVEGCHWNVHLRICEYKDWNVFAAILCVGGFGFIAGLWEARRDAKIRKEMKNDEENALDFHARRIRFLEGKAEVIKGGSFCQNMWLRIFNEVKILKLACDDKAHYISRFETVAVWIGLFFASSCATAWIQKSTDNPEDTISQDDVLKINIAVPFCVNVIAALHSWLVSKEHVCKTQNESKCCHKCMSIFPNTLTMILYLIGMGACFLAAWLVSGLVNKRCWLGVQFVFGVVAPEILSFLTVMLNFCLKWKVEVKKSQSCLWVNMYSYICWNGVTHLSVSTRVLAKLLKIASPKEIYAVGLHFTDEKMIEALKLADPQTKRQPDPPLTQGAEIEL